MDLGNIYFTKGDFEISLEYFSLAKDIIFEKYGEMHINYACILNNIAMIYLKLKDLDSSEKNLNTAIEIFKISSSSHSEYNSININMGILQVSKGNFLKAYDLFKHSFLDLTNNSPDHPDSGKALLNFIYVSIQTKKIEFDYQLIKVNWNYIRNLIDVNLLNDTYSLNVQHINTLLKDDIYDLANIVHIEMSNPILMFIIPLKYIR
jgi:tetratricopeptide (TPR) repeat protein